MAETKREVTEAGDAARHATASCEPASCAALPGWELVVCTTCRKTGESRAEADASGAPRAGARLAQALTGQGIPYRAQECLSSCERGCTVVFRGPGRWSYVQGGLDPERDLDDILAMIRAYGATADGVVPWRERPQVIRKNTIARIPPLEF